MPEIDRESFLEALQEEDMPFSDYYAESEGDAHSLWMEANEFANVYWNMFCFDGSNPISWLDVENSLVHVLDHPQDFEDECNNRFVIICRELLDSLRDNGYINRTDPFNLFRQRRNRRYRWEAPLKTKMSNTFSNNPYTQLVGLEIEVIDNTVDNHVEEHEMADDEGDLTWDCVHDGSINAGSEFRLRTITNGDRLLNDITSFCKKMKNRGYTVDDSCGVHMHIDFREGNLYKLKRLINFYSRYEQFIYDIVGEERKTLRYSQSLRMTDSSGNLVDSGSMLRFGPLADAMNSSNLREFKTDFYNTEHYRDAQSYKYYDGRYSGFNVHSIFSNGTLELRYLRGSLNENYINNWVMLNLHIIDKFMSEHGQSTEGVNLLHSRNKPTLSEFYGWLDDSTINIYKKLRKSFKYEVRK